MSSFTDKLIVSKLNAREWEVEREFIYYIGNEDSDDYVIIPKGFITDFASVPRGLWTFFPPDGQYTQAAVLHDFLYSTQMFDRKDCDNIFLEAMAVLKVKRWKRTIMYWAVRVFGGWYWKNNAEKII